MRFLFYATSMSTYASCFHSCSMCIQHIINANLRWLLGINGMAKKTQLSLLFYRFICEAIWYAFQMKRNWADITFWSLFTSPSLSIISNLRIFLDWTESYFSHEFTLWWFAYDSLIHTFNITCLKIISISVFLTGCKHLE